MNVEEVGLIADTITAGSAVVGIVVAATLGWKSILLARESVEISEKTTRIALDTQKRAEKDYLSGRADFIAANLNDVMDRIAQFRSDIHPFWKEIPHELLVSTVNYAENQTTGKTQSEIELRLDVMKERVVFLDQQRLLSEVAVHGSIYKLNAAGRRLADSLESVEHLRLGADAQEGARLDSEAAVAALKIVLRSVYPHYISLIADVHPPTPQEGDFEDWFFSDLQPSIDNNADRRALTEARRWMASKLNDGVKYGTPELTQNFIEHFAVDGLVEAVSSITSSLYRAAAPQAARQ